MANNEDYLDSLLKAAAAETNPDSAINRVREFSKRETEEKENTIDESAETEEVLTDSFDIQKEDTISMDDLLSMSVSDDTNASNEDSLTELTLEDTMEPDDAMNSIAENSGSTIEGISLDGVANEEVLASELMGDKSFEEAGIDETVNDLSSIEEIVKDKIIEENALEENALEDNTLEENTLEENTLEENTLEENTLEESVIEENKAEEPATDEIEELLKSDFSGEIEVPDISSLLDNAEAFANSDEELIKEPLDVISEATSDEVLDDVEETPDLDSLLSGLSEISDTSEDNADDELSFSEDEINNLLESASKPEDDPSKREMEIDLSDIGALENDLGIRDKDTDEFGLGDLKDDAEISEITDLLHTIDSNELPTEGEEVDMLDLLNEAVSRQEEDEEKLEKERIKAKAIADAAKEEEQENSKKKGKKGKKEKKKKDPEPENEELILPKKKGFFGRLLDFLTAEEEEDNGLLNPQDATEKTEGFEGVPGENQEILNEMDKEAEEETGKKKKKSKKDKKSKKKKGEDKEPSGDEEGEEDDSEAKEDTKKKKKKEKKERKPLELDIDTGKPLSKKNVSLVFIMALSLLVALLVVILYIPKLISNSYARKAYYTGDYETVYTSFYGNKLSDSDQILFDRSEVILKMAHKYDSYRIYMNMEMKTEALDQLIQGVDNYEKWLILAEKSGAVNEFNEQYAKVVNALMDSFGLSIEGAKEISALETDLEYTLMCESVANGTEYIDPNDPLPAAFVPPTESELDTDPEYEDMLPEEGN